MSTSATKETRTKPKTTSTISWVSDKLAAGAARVNGGEFQDVEIAVVKATNHDITPPKEKHVRTLRETVASSSNSKKVIYMVHALYERLMAPNESWLVVLKTLMVFHKLLKDDGDATLKLQMTRYKEKRKVTELLKLHNFTDKSQKEAWDYSAFVRVYSSYLEERISVFEAIKFDVDRDGAGTNVRFKSANGTQLLAELPRVQKLLQRMLTCVPEGAAAENEVVMTAMQWLLTECFRLYRVISEGVIHLAEQFFEMDRVDATKGLEMYREAIHSASQMQTFFSAVQGMPVGRQIQFPQLTPPPEDFLEQMEEYVKGATSRTTTRRFNSTISRNARGNPSSAIVTQTDEKPTVLQPIIGIESKTPAQEDDLLGLDALEISTPAVEEVPPQIATKTAGSDPFGDTVFQTAEPARQGSLLDDWGQSAVVGSPMAGSSVTAEQNTSPFDDFFGGGPMAQPPPAQETFPFVQQPVPQAPQQPLPGLASAPVPSLPIVPDNNPFGGLESTNQLVYQQPAAQLPGQHRSLTAAFSGPGALADPFAELTPAIKKKSSFVAPGAPMRQQSFGANPFGGPTQLPSDQPPQQPSANSQQGFASFF